MEVAKGWGKREFDFKGLAKPHRGRSLWPGHLQEVYSAPAPAPTPLTPPPSTEHKLPRIFFQHFVFSLIVIIFIQQYHLMEQCSQKTRIRILFLLQRLQNGTSALIFRPLHFFNGAKYRNIDIAKCPLVLKV